MLPQWRDEARVWLAPREMRLRRLARGIRSKCLAETTRPFESTQFEWRPALAALHACLGEPEWRGVNVRVVLSNLWTRYAIVPWSDGLANEDERAAHARILLSEAYGGMGDDWQVCLSDAAPGEPRIACAAPTGLLTELRATLESRRIRMLSVQPRLVAAYNQWRERLPEGAGWFVSVEEGSLAAARLVPGGWDRVYTARIGADWAMELLRLKTFARMAVQHADKGPVCVDAPARLRKLAGACDAGIEWLESAEDVAAAHEQRHLRPVRLHT